MGRAIQPKVLVVEDDADVRSLAAALLEETSLEVVEMESAEEAIAFLREQGAEVAMIFADIRLPGTLDGVQLARIAGTLWPHIPVLLTSGETPSIDRLPDSATFMPKPWRALDVLMAVEKVAMRA